MAMWLTHNSKYADEQQIESEFGRLLSPIPLKNGDDKRGAPRLLISY